MQRFVDFGVQIGTHLLLQPFFLSPVRIYELLSVRAVSNHT
jgi:hypothetical protein